MEVSVIITSYNQQSLLCEAIESVLEQTATADEILIVDADSDDGSQEVIKEYEENNPSQVVSILLEDDPGIPKMRNRALKEVSGDYVAILDGDDRFLPQKIETEKLRIQQNPEAVAVYSNVYITDVEGNRIGRRYKRPQSSGRIFAEVFCGQFGMLRSMLIDYDVFEEIGFLDPEFFHYDGFDFTVELAKYHDISYIHQPLVEYRKHPGGAAGWREKSDELPELQGIFEKHQEYLQTLQPETRMEVERYWQALLADLRAGVEFNQGNYRSAINWYFKGTQYDRRTVINYKRCLNFLLPAELYNHLQKIYWRLHGDEL